MTTDIGDVTLNTGHYQSFNRFMVHGGTIKLCKKLLAKLMAGGFVDFPGGEFGHLAIKAEMHPDVIFVTVYGPNGPRGKNRKHHIGNVIPIMTFLVSLNGNSEAWQACVDMYKKEYNADPMVTNEPSAPYSASVIHSYGGMHFINALPLLADFSRCLACAWIASK